MKNENKIINKGGVGFCGLLTIVLIGLKVAGVDMSWFWVFSPMILLVILIILLIISLYILLK